MNYSRICLKGKGKPAKIPVMLLDVPAKIREKHHPSLSLELRRYISLLEGVVYLRIRKNSLSMPPPEKDINFSNVFTGIFVTCPLVKR
jgi:hypothetical protein